MVNKTLDDMEKKYNEKLEENYLAILHGKVSHLTEEELKERILKFLREQKICTLATCAHNIPRSTPVRYRSDGLTLYILTEGGGKVQNLRENKAVSVSIVGEYSGFKSVTCLQLWGTAEIIEPQGGQKYEEARGKMDLEEREDLKHIKVKNIRTEMYVIKISPQKARFLSFPEGILNQTLIIA
jgi:nitroimidazol reductase NimA-like FMN-containing flavoprotein (pyridoxamine 5'-phosphate oxidase superfamily)